MKRLKHFKFLITFLLLIFSQNMFSQDSWDFPFKPGMAEWKSFNNSREKIAACQIPDSILISLSTPDLLELCLKYPLLIDILAFNNIMDGLNRYSRNFNGFQEFINREDACLALMEKYKEANPLLIQEKHLFKEKFYFMMRISLMELFFCTPQILSKLDNYDKKELINACSLKKSQKASGDRLYRFTGLQTVNLAIIRILESENSDLDKSINMDIVLPYVTCGLVISKDVNKEIDYALSSYLSK